ncbi:MAG TPA: metal-dependent hydrolase [Mycobacteriales bacterium]|nr:metal-dependent hydrolase [Mycobacteriales bacterium]
MTAAAIDDPVHEIKPRRVGFDWEPTPLRWIPGEPVTSHIIDVLHLLLPAGERWFVHVYKQVLPMIDDEQLRADVKGFMGQEAVHSRAHAAVLDHLQANGLNPDPFVRRIDWLFKKLLGDESMRLIPRKRWLLERVAIIAAIEHFTAVLGAWILDSPALDAAGADATMLDLLRWHGAEEVEHRSVAFDVFRAVNGNRFSRILSMVVSAATMAYLWRRGMRFLCAADPTYVGPAPKFRDFYRASRKGLLPTPQMLALAIPRYCRHDYHPSQEADTQVALDYLAASPAAVAAAA